MKLVKGEKGWPTDTGKPIWLKYSCLCHLQKCSPSGKKAETHALREPMSETLSKWVDLVQPLQRKVGSYPRLHLFIISIWMNNCHNEYILNRNLYYFREKQHHCELILFDHLRIPIVPPKLQWITALSASITLEIVNQYQYALGLWNYN